MRTFLFSCIFLWCVPAFADVSRQQAADFAVRFIEISRSGKGDEKLRALIDDRSSTNGLIGWWEYFSLSETDSSLDPTELDVNRILIREPDLANPMQIKLTDLSSAKCLIPPEKIVVVYFSNRKDTRAVTIMALVSNHGTIRLCPMVVESATDESITPPGHVTKEIPLQKNLSPVPGVEIIKIADDQNSYGFAPPKETEKAVAITTNPLGCSLRQTILYLVDEGVWVKGLNYLPSGRFNIHCELLAGESGSVENKLLSAIAGTFDLNIKMDDHYTLTGYRVSAPNPLPACFQVTKEAVGVSAMHGIGYYEGYSLKKIISNAVYHEPFDFLSTNNTGRYDLHLKVWPEAFGEMAALQQLGFEITQTNLQRKTLVIDTR